MSESLPARFHRASATAAFAGLVGAGLCDVVCVLLRGHDARGVEVLALALGLYGIAGLVAAVLLGFAVGTLLRSLPGGWSGLADEAVDARVCGLLLGGTAGAMVLAVGAAIGHKAFVSSMNSQTLAAIASAGLAVIMAVPAALVVLGSWRAFAELARRFVPRPARLARTGVVGLGLGGLGVLCLIGALSRADWRVLDLGPLWAAGVALVLAVAHAWFWHASARGRRLARRLPLRVVRASLAALVVVLLVVGSGIKESSPTYAAIGEGALGLKLALKLARHATDRDGDGYSARFGGGDCDDTRADVYPGAEDIPGDGIDQNCEGGDAPLPTATAETEANTAKPAVAPTIKGKAGAYSGNILIIAVDATRADRLGVAGYGRPAGHSLTPNLDGLAKRGAYFRRAWAQAPNTPRSFPSFVTSRYPSEIAWEKKTFNYSPLLPSNHTFFEPLAAAGWKPIGIFSHFYFTADRGISKGFAEWSDEGAKSIADSNKDIAAPRIVPRVLERLQRAASKHERFVLWTHLFEPHSSYMSHPEFPTSLSGVQGLEEKYDYEIAYDDQWIGKILKTLDDSGLAGNTAVVAFGDHGEAWGEHNRVYFHGQNLTEEQLRVPLIITVPGRSPVVSDDEVGLIDVGPTLLDLAGIPIPSYLHGRSLLPIIEGGALPPRPLFAELLPSTATPDHHVAMIDRGRKLVHKVSDRRFELFDLKSDPRQMKNLADEPAHHALLDELKTKLLAHEEKRRAP